MIVFQIWLTGPQMWLCSPDGPLQFQSGVEAYQWIDDNLTGLDMVYYHVVSHVTQE